jgi:hypothetical protein
MTTVTFDQLNQHYENYTSMVRCECVFATELVGGQPADEAGIRAYVKHHLKLENEEAEAAVQRILHEEIENTTPPEGEIPEGKLYGLRAIRKDEEGWPYLGDWMIKAAIKVATSRLFIFQQLLGSKGGFAEAGRVRGWQYSAHKEHPNFVYLCNQTADGPAHTYFKEFMGRVTTAKGPMSIVHQSECVPPGSRFAFEFRFMTAKDLKQDHIESMLALLMIVGVGSARSLECGKFRIEKAEIEMAKVYEAKPPKPPTGKKADKTERLNTIRLSGTEQQHRA